VSRNVFYDFGDSNSGMPMPEIASYRAVEASDLAQGALPHFTQCW